MSSFDFDVGSSYHGLLRPPDCYYGEPNPRPPLARQSDQQPLGHADHHHFALVTAADHVADTHSCFPESGPVEAGSVAETAIIRRAPGPPPPPPPPSVPSVPLAKSVINNSRPCRSRRITAVPLVKCSYCPQRLDSDKELKDHIPLCIATRPHQCRECDKRFKTPSGLLQHQRSHAQDRRYPCTQCDKRFIQKSHLDQHERIHTGAKPFICQWCGQAFRQRSQQMCHEATHGNQLADLE